MKPEKNVKSETSGLFWKQKGEGDIRKVN